jgi:hypothetical protein
MVSVASWDSSQHDPKEIRQNGAIPSLFLLPIY